MYLNYILNLIIPPKNPLPQINAADLAQYLREKPWPVQNISSWICSSFTYHDPDIQKIIFHLKKYRDKQIFSAVSERLHDQLIEIETKHLLLHNCRQTIIVPIPLHPAAYKKRGFNQSLLLAQAVIKRNPHQRQLSTNLVCTRQKAKQALLSRLERMQNTGGIYQYKGHPLPPNSLVIILDDVTTTGATLHEARRQLLRHAPEQNLKAMTLAH